MPTSYIPNTKAEQDEMLAAIGVAAVEDLFADIPEAVRLRRDLNLPPARSEGELVAHMQALANENASGTCFAGGGIYDHFIPAAVSEIIGRQEFYSAYTPYQAEMSQGTLQTIFEYQTMICRLTGMDISNASLYDGATACVEAMLIAADVTRRNEIVLAGAIHPEYIAVIKTYARFRNLRITDEITDNCAAVIAQNPNYYGLLEDLETIGQAAKAKGALFIVSVDPISLGILETPAAFGADIVVGEGQALGNPMNFGGPGFGFFACKAAYMRKVPGRIVGETTDANGKRGFLLTLQAREQHIRREKAGSNICSNQALCALAATVYMSIMGKEGLRKVAELCLQKAHYLYDALLATGKFAPRFTAPFFKEFALTYTGGDIKTIYNTMRDNGMTPGIILPDNGLLIAVTEKRTKAEMDVYARSVR
ncbi:MAG: aminomethyl-transferring glycine dehydrogenase subunit GcvPA [Clostridiales bacterium]|nr:aminomethyl-transferring glycine dehydrogenase subunit GcvPA [Clostridiales bacterium]